ncbi:DNA polymerase [Pontiella sulfatireligans]|uniref:DNA-directed DNA polymerase n=1 Tax=Pontiella sulfatireligans TaxID=2750658 RepID=A0A6C2UIJ8_9BACT|nr:DNA polymerase [Pontiella sulfatireligans]VGO19144.1 DNA polymerase I, thermostable [Pontiella sulfatireligans]
MSAPNSKLPTPNCTAILAVDFETYYDRDYSLRKMDARTYVHHPKFDCYLMSIYGYVPQASRLPCPSSPSSDLCLPSSELFSWCGHPKDFSQWHLLSGATLVAHNAAFDSLVFKRLQALGVIPDFKSQVSGFQFPVWRCTASLAVYLSAPRSLKGACKQLLGIAVDKTQRDKAKGQASGDLFGNEAMAAYALEDARLCYLLWDKFNHLWSAEEQELATLTFEWGQHGIAVDSQRLAASIRTLETQRFNAAQALPWVDDLDEDTPLSHRKLAEECRKADIPCPASLAMDDPECAAWEDKYGADYAWVDAMRIFRRTNMLLKRFHTVRSRSFPVPLASRLPCRTAGVSPAQSAPSPNAQCLVPNACTYHFPYSLKYFGAVPGRWSGDAGFNVQNMPRGELFDVDLRRCFIPSPGNVFIIADLCQIEPRILAWLIGDAAFLDLVRSGIDIYEAHARSTMGYTDPRPLKEVDSDMRSLAKARTLGLGYGCGPKKFVAVAKNLGGIDITFSEAKQTVQDFRSKNPKITRLWQRLDRDFKRSAGSDYHIELPSGRELRYLSVCKNPRGYYTAETERGGRKRILYGGLLTENLVQATARDVFAEQLLNIHRYLCSTGISARDPASPCTAGVPPAQSAPQSLQNSTFPVHHSAVPTPFGRIVFHVHDEVIVEVPLSIAEQAREQLLAIMSTTPDWLSGCPVEAEATIHNHYTK